MEKKDVLLLVEKNKEKLSEQQYRTIKGQIHAGDIDGASKGVVRLLKRLNDIKVILE